MTDLAFAGKCALPSGGRQTEAVSATAAPCRKSMAPRARPVKPIPVSARNDRRVIPGQQLFARFDGIAKGSTLDARLLQIVSPLLVDSPALIRLRSVQYSFQQRRSGVGPLA